MDSNLQILQIKSSSVNDTFKLAFQIGRKLKGGEVIELVSDLGGGKTAFVRGLAQGIGSKDNVSSPSFTLSNLYRTENLTLHHFDFYRLHEPGIMREALAEVIGDPRAVVVIEWADIVEDALPASRLTIRIAVTAETRRLINFEFPNTLNYLLLT